MEVPHITILGTKNDHLFLKEIPKAKEIMSRSIIGEVRGQKAAKEYKDIGPLTFNGLVQAEAASHMTLIDGCNLQLFSESWGLQSYAEFPLTREDVWKLVVGSRNGSEALATDIVYNLRRENMRRTSLNVTIALCSVPDYQNGSPNMVQWSCIYSPKRIVWNLPGMIFYDSGPRKNKEALICAMHSIYVQSRCAIILSCVHKDCSPEEHIVQSFTTY